MKQFRHYLLGRPFQLVTDHAPLQWLSAQKMEGMLAIQEYDFTITYRKGAENGNPDALSRRDNSQAAAAATTVFTMKQKLELKHAQELKSKTQLSCTFVKHY